MENIELSIIVPTYNGGAWIEDTLESVMSQLEAYKDVAELIVRDNNSSDNTYEVFNKINVRYGNIAKYDKRVETAIADVNFKESVEMANGNYVVLLGDDDLLFPNYIANTIRLIEEYPNIGLIYYNRISTTRDYRGAALKHTNPNRKFVTYYERVEDFIKDHPTGPDFMSVNVVKKDCLVKGLQNTKEIYYGVEWYYANLYGLKGFKCISTFYPMILQRTPLKRAWNDRMLLYVVIGMDNMFKDISQLYPSVIHTWQNYSKKNISRYRYILASIPLKPSLYKEKWNELSPKLTLCQRMLAKLLIEVPELSKPLRLIILGPLTVKDICKSIIKDYLKR